MNTTTAVLELPWTKPPMSMNDRQHYMVRARLTKDIRATARSLAASKRLPAGLDHVSVALVYRPRDRRRRDTDNLMPVLKALCDGLVDHGLVSDDTPQWMTKHMPRLEEPEKGAGGAMWLEISWTAPGAPETTPPTPDTRERRERAPGARAGRRNRHYDGRQTMKRSDISDSDVVQACRDARAAGGSSLAHLIERTNAPRKVAIAAMKRALDRDLIEYGVSIAYAWPNDDVVSRQLTAHRWLPGHPIPYDEMRRILGLPDVKHEVELLRLQRAAREIAPHIAATFNRLGAELVATFETIRPTIEHIAEISRPKHQPPMWVNDPARTRRTKYKPSRRVK